MNTKKLGCCIASIFLAILLFFTLGTYASNPANHTKTMNSLDEKVTTVLELAAASTAASAAVSMIPGDTATPIAEKLADFSTYFVIVLCVLYLEKYLLTITGAAAFKILVPISLLLLGASFYVSKKWCRSLAKKLCVFGIAIYVAIPLSIMVSDMVYKTYESSINQTIETVQEVEEYQEQENTDGVISTITSWFSTTTESLTEKTTGIVSDFIESIAILIVTSCLIPLLVLAFIVWITKIILGIDIPILSGYHHRHTHAEA